MLFVLPLPELNTTFPDLSDPEYCVLKLTFEDFWKLKLVPIGCVSTGYMLDGLNVPIDCDNYLLSYREGFVW